MADFNLRMSTELRMTFADGLASGLARLNDLTSAWEHDDAQQMQLLPSAVQAVVGALNRVGSADWTISEVDMAGTVVVPWLEGPDGRALVSARAAQRRSATARELRLAASTSDALDRIRERKALARARAENRLREEDADAGPRPPKRAPDREADADAPTIPSKRARRSGETTFFEEELWGTYGNASDSASKQDENTTDDTEWSEEDTQS
jgi:hypothetical protein